MSERLFDTLDSIRSDSGIASLDEATVRQVVVLRILNVLGWNTFDHREVTPEFGVGGGQVDYCLRIARQSKVFIEVKRGGENLYPHQDQLLRYSFERGVGLATLTNGLDWWFYLPLREGSWEERRFSAISITSADNDAVQAVFNNALSKNGVASGSAIEYAENLLDQQRRAILVNTTLPRAWQELIEEPDSLLVELLSETVERIAQVRPDASRVRDFIRNAWTQRATSPDTAPAHEPPARLPRIANRSAARPRNRRSPPPEAFVFLGTRYPAHTWKDALQGLSEIMYELHASTFDEGVSELRGTSRVYYSRDPNDLDEPRSVGASGYFVETKWAAKPMLDQCHRLITRFGYSESDLKIVLGGQSQ